MRTKDIRLMIRLEMAQNWCIICKNWPEAICPRNAFQANEMILSSSKEEPFWSPFWFWFWFKVMVYCSNIFSEIYHIKRNRRILLQFKVKGYTIFAGVKEPSKISGMNVTIDFRTKLNSQSLWLLTVEPPCATTSRKRPPLISDHLSKTPKLSQSKPYRWNF